MQGLALNLILALVWALFLGEVSLRSLSLGLMLGFGVMWLFQRPLNTERYVRMVLGTLRLLLYFVVEMVRANLVMARLALQPRPELHQMVIGVPLTLRGEVPLTLLAALIGLMPGTVTLGFSPEQDVMYVHSAGLESRQAVLDSVLSIERRMLHIVGEE